MRAQESALVLGTGPRVVGMMAASGLDYDVISAHIGDVYRGGFPEVITPEMAQEAPADVLIVPPWRRREALENWHDAIMAGMRLVFVEPEFLVIDADNYATELGRALAVTDGPGSVATLRAALSAMGGPVLSVVDRQVAP